MCVKIGLVQRHEKNCIKTAPPRAPRAVCHLFAIDQSRQGQMAELVNSTMGVSLASVLFTSSCVLLPTEFCTDKTLYVGNSTQR